MPKLHVCPRCAYTTAIRTHYGLHILRQKTCQDFMNSGQSIEQIRTAWNRDTQAKTICLDCGVRYTSKGMKFYHKNHCPARRYRELPATIPVVNAVESGPSVFRDSVINNPITVTGDNNIVTPTYNVTNHIVTNVIVNPFGQEDIGYLTANEEQFWEFIFSRILAKQERGIIEFVRLKYFHPDHPENRSVRILHLTQSEDDDNTVQVWDGRAWKTREAASVFDDMMFQVNEDTRFAVEDSIKKERDVEKVKRRRKVLDAVMTGCGTWLDIEFGEVVPEGCSMYDKGRGRFYSGAMFEQSRAEDRRRLAEFYGTLRREIIVFQNQIR